MGGISGVARCGGRKDEADDIVDFQTAMTISTGIMLLLHFSDLILDQKYTSCINYYFHIL